MKKTHINQYNNFFVKLFILIFLGVVKLDFTYSQPPSSDYKLVFSDHFESNIIDGNAWWVGGDNNCETQCGDGCDCFFWYRPENVQQSNSKLILTGKSEETYCNNIKRSHTSGKVQSAAEFKYGYFEIRAKVPSGIGFWPAFWFWSGNYEENYQEIDMFEFCGCDCDKFQAGYFYENDYNSILADDVPHLFKKIQVGNNACDHFNVYGVEWQEDSIRYFVNGILEFSTINIAVTQRMALILNLAIGGCWNCGSSTCNPSNSTVFPGQFEIDWVKIWEKENKAIEVLGANELCVGDTYNFKANNYPNATYTWSSSSGLAVASFPWLNFDGGTWRHADITALTGGNQQIILKVTFPNGYVETKLFEVNVRLNTPEATDDIIPVTEVPSCCYSLSLPDEIPNAVSYLWEINYLNDSQSPLLFSTKTTNSGICFTDQLLFVQVTSVNVCGASDSYNENVARPPINGCLGPIQVFPNPADDQITIYLEHFTSNNSFGDSNSLKISDLLGRLVYSGKFDDYYKIININNFNNGLYYIYIKYNNVEFSSQFIKSDAD